MISLPGAGRPMPGSWPRTCFPCWRLDIILVSDAAQAYQTFAKAAGITHQFVNVAGGSRTRGALHIQNVNGRHSRFKTSLRRFNVASRYLDNYTGWQGVLDAAALVAPSEWLRVAVALARWSTGR